MRQKKLCCVKLCLVALILLYGVICSGTKCNDALGVPESRLLINFDKLRSQSHVKIATGVILRRKKEFIDVIGNTTECRSGTNVLQQFFGKVGQIMKSHVLEFDLSSILANGK